MEKVVNSIGISGEAFWALLGYLSTFLIGMFYPVKGLVWFAGFLIFADLTTGIWASVVTKGEKFDSNKLYKSVAKIFLYPMAIYFSHKAETLIPEIPFVKGCAFLLVIVEGKSLEENFSTILKIDMFRYIKVFVLRGRKGLIEMMDKKDNKDIE